MNFTTAIVTLRIFILGIYLFILLGMLCIYITHSPCTIAAALREIKKKYIPRKEFDSRVQKLSRDSRSESVLLDLTGRDILGIVYRQD